MPHPSTPPNPPKKWKEEERMNKGKSKRKKKKNHLLQAANHCTKPQRTQKMVENCYEARRNKHTPDYIEDGP